MTYFERSKNSNLKLDIFQGLFRPFSRAGFHDRVFCCRSALLGDGKVGEMLDMFEIGFAVWNFGLPRFPNSFFI